MAKKRKTNEQRKGESASKSSRFADEISKRTTLTKEYGTLDYDSFVASYDVLRPVLMDIVGKSRLALAPVTDQSPLITELNVYKPQKIKIAEGNVEGVFLQYFFLKTPW